MNTSANSFDAPMAKNVTITRDTLRVDLSDGRTIAAPLAWFPRLFHSTHEERCRWRLIGKGKGIHWEDIDEDISIEGLLAGKRSGESHASFKKWLDKRNGSSEVFYAQTRRKNRASASKAPAAAR